VDSTVRKIAGITAAAMAAYMPIWATQNLFFLLQNLERFPKKNVIPFALFIVFQYLFSGLFAYQAYYILRMPSDKVK
jgi:hypothetical protein